MNRHQQVQTAWDGGHGGSTEARAADQELKEWLGDNFLEMRFRMDASNTIYGSPELMISKKTDVSELAVRMNKEITPELAAGRDAVVYGVFENTLSERGVYEVTAEVGRDNCELTILVYGTERPVFDGTTEEVLRYIQENHWYGDPQPGWED